MTEINEEEVDWKDVLFIVGAQVTADGDMLPGSFSVFSRTTKPEDAIGVVLDKIADDLIELEVPKSEGSLAFAPIRTWEEFAEFPIDPLVKLEAIIAAGVYEFLDTMRGSRQTGGLAGVPWVHRCADHD